jgi:VanZ family protein
MPKIEIDHLDKIYHYWAYFLLAILWYFFFYKRFMDQQDHNRMSFSVMYKNWSRTIAIGTMTLCTVIGGAVELAQGYLATNRSMDIYDMLANLCGIVFAVLILKGMSYISNVGKKSKSF